ncbi:hypothetical protein AYI69_g7043, partial [Smittium culicis]
MFTNPLDSTSN